MQHGPHWKTLRRFTLRALRDFGLGKTSLEDKIKDEVEIVLAELYYQMTGSLDKPYPTLYVPSYLDKGRCHNYVYIYTRSSFPR